MAEKTTVAFRIDESRKSEWEIAAEGPEYDSLSHLIRLAVEREIAESGTASRNAPADTEGTVDQEVLESLSQIERVTEEIQEELKAVGREEQAGRYYDLEQVLLEILPSAPSSYVPSSPEDPDPPEVGQTPRDIAGKIGADTSDVEEALDSLDEKVGQVQSMAGHYWRREL